MVATTAKQDHKKRKSYAVDVGTAEQDSNVQEDCATEKRTKKPRQKDHQLNIYSKENMPEGNLSIEFMTEECEGNWGVLYKGIVRLCNGQDEMEIATMEAWKIRTERLPADYLHEALDSLSSQLDQLADELFDWDGEIRKNIYNEIGDGMEIWQTSAFLFIDQITVMPEYRGLDLGLLLLDEACKWINDQMSLTLLMAVPFDREYDRDGTLYKCTREEGKAKLEKYYRRLGFRRIGKSFLGRWNGFIMPDLHVVSPHLYRNRPETSIPSNFNFVYDVDQAKGKEKPRNLSMKIGMKHNLTTRGSQYRIFTGKLKTWSYDEYGEEDTTIGQMRCIKLPLMSTPDTGFLFTHYSCDIKKFDTDLADVGILYIDYVHLQARYRGVGLGLAIIDKVCDVLEDPCFSSVGSHCTIFKASVSQPRLRLYLERIGFEPLNDHFVYRNGFHYSGRRPAYQEFDFLL